MAAGFTLIEVLVAMMVLSILVLMVANIFQSSSESWNIGTQKADMNTAARAALDYMARELQSAVAGPIEKAGSAGAQYLTFRQEKIDDIRFLTLANDPNASENERAVRGVFFYLDPAEYSLRAGRKVNTATVLDCYASPSTWDNAKVGNLLITNAASLSFYVYENEVALHNGDFINTYPAILNELPFCMDIALEMLSDDDMQRYIATGKDSNFKARNAKVYTTRVYFPNRKGYGGR
ncbi:MAG: prepilin-type N-terminal cleavage/methylation domain-containing protein [Chloroflexota bacterium]